MANELQDYVNNIVVAPTPKLGPLSALMKTRARYLSRAKVLELCMHLAADVPGSIVEFGVASGNSTRVLRSVSSKPIYALDSFEGLREKFERAEVGAFAGPVPDIPGVNFVKGYFEDTCNEALAARVKRIAFAHLDADLYSSTLFALRWIAPLLVDGSLILFDEFIGSGKAEARAFSEWQAESGITVVRIAEFDREPSGWGDLPDKRLLFQVISDKPSSSEPLTWAAKQATALKFRPAPLNTLGGAEKIDIKPGETISSVKHAAVADHTKLSLVKIKGETPTAPDWFIYSPHWEKV